MNTHRKVGAAITAAFTAFTLWAFLAEIDIVASAQGKLAPISFVRVSQPAEGGVIRSIRVRDGETVAAGAVLVELDPVAAAQDERSSAQQAERLELQIERIDAELTGRAFEPTKGSAENRAAVLEEHETRMRALAAAQTEATAAVDRATSDVRTTQERLTQAERRLPLVSKQSDMLQTLRSQGFASEKDATDKLKDLVDAQQELAVQTAALRANKAAVGQAQAALERVQAEYRQRLTTERAQAVADLNPARAEMAKRGHRLSQTKLTAPVAGTVNGLSSLAPGQVVGTGASLLSIVPKDEPLRFEGWVRNEDAAYVLPGMPAKVKVAAYPFQKYGWADAEVSWIGVDSETPESMRNAQGEHLFYRVRLNLKRQALTRDGKTYSLTPGMQAVGEIQIGKRTLVEYLTSPVRKVLLEAARER